MFKVICQPRHLRIFSLYETGEKKNFFFGCSGDKVELFTTTPDSCADSVLIPSNREKETISRVYVRNISPVGRYLF